MVERFDAVEGHPDYPAAMAHEPHVSTALYEAITIVMLVAGLCFLGIGLLLLFAFPPMGLFWVATCGGFVYLAHRAYREAKVFAAAPIVRSVRAVLRTRTEISGGSSFGDHSSGPSTSYFVTVVDRGGDRVELKTDGRIVGTLVEGDIGVAYTKRNRIVEFRRFDV